MSSSTSSADAPPLAAEIEPLATRGRKFAFDRFRFMGAKTHMLACQWKTYVENYLEGYHIPLVHPELSAAIDVASYAVEVEDPAVFHHAQPNDGASVDGLWGFLWPNLAINTYADGVMLERVVPMGPARRGSTISISSRTARGANALTRLRTVRRHHGPGHLDLRGSAKEPRRRHIRQGAPVAPPRSGRRLVSVEGALGARQPACLSRVRRAATVAQRPAYAVGSMQTPSARLRISS